MADLKFKTRAKIARVQKIADSLSGIQAKPLRELCTAHAAMAETNARLWHDNKALRDEIAALKGENP